MDQENAKKFVALTEEFSQRLASLERLTGIKTRLILTAGYDDAEVVAFSFRVNGRVVEPHSQETFDILETFSQIQNFLGF